MKKIGLISCSNGLNENNKLIIDNLISTLSELGIKTQLAPTLFAIDGPFSGSGKERADALMTFYKDDSIHSIFDVSGGDLANEILPYIDFQVIKDNPKNFFGYSDLSVILNSIYSQTEHSSYLFQIRNLVLDKSGETLKNFKSTFLDGTNDLLDFDYKWLQGSFMSGVVIGGNLRCTLKLAGTRFMANFKDSILLIESLGGDVSKISTYLTQYKLMGAFDNVKGIIIGQFTEMEKNNLQPTIEELIIKIVDDKSIPIARTLDIGHSFNSKAIVIGKNINLS